MTGPFLIFRGPSADTADGGWSDEGGRAGCRPGPLFPLVERFEILLSLPRSGTSRFQIRDLVIPKFICCTFGRFIGLVVCDRHCGSTDKASRGISDSTKDGSSYVLRRKQLGQGKWEPQQKDRRNYKRRKSRRRYLLPRPLGRLEISLSAIHGQHDAQK
jgi:hypothetical protein